MKPDLKAIRAQALNRLKRKPKDRWAVTATLALCDYAEALEMALRLVTSHRDAAVQQARHVKEAFDSVEARTRAKALEEARRCCRLAVLAPRPSRALETETWNAALLRVDKAIEALASSAAPTHDLVVADEGTEGIATWVARCTCGWVTLPKIEEDADRAADAHRASVEAAVTTCPKCNGSGVWRDVSGGLERGGYCDCGAAPSAPTCAKCDGEGTVEETPAQDCDLAEHVPCPDCAVKP